MKYKNKKNLKPGLAGSKMDILIKPILSLSFVDDDICISNF